MRRKLFEYARECVTHSFVNSQFLYSRPAVSFWSTNLRENSFIQKICKNPEFQIRPKGKIRFDIKPES